MTILSAVCLSVYRIENSRSSLTAFIAISVVNAIYCCMAPLPPTANLAGQQN